jgi:hypothetical protein
MEALIWHFKIVMGETEIPPGEVYHSVEGGNGELGFYLISDGGRTPYRLHFRRPCFIYYQAYSEMTKGAMLSDAVIVMSSLNLLQGDGCLIKLLRLWLKFSDEKLKKSRRDHLPLPGGEAEECDHPGAAPGAG